MTDANTPAPPPIDRDTVVARTRTMFESDADGEVVALDPDTSDCFGFNATASELWRLIERPCTVATLVERLTEQFAVDDATCERDIAVALAWLRDQGLVTLERPTPT